MNDRESSWQDVGAVFSGLSFMLRPFGWGIHRSQVNSAHKGQWPRALMFSLITCSMITQYYTQRNHGGNSINLRFTRETSSHDMHEIWQLHNGSEVIYGLSFVITVEKLGCEMYMVKGVPIESPRVSSLLCCSVSLLSHRIKEITWIPPTHQILYFGFGVDFKCSNFIITFVSWVSWKR